MKDPYEVLGIARTATDDEIKQAYRTLAKKYHPDNYVNDPMAKIAEEKMKEINAAYEQIQKMRSDPSAESDYGYGGTFDEKETYARVRRFINNGDILRAETLLDIFSVSDRGAEWNFLKGCVYLRKGYYYDAQRSFETACYLDPTNQEYRTALDQIRSARNEQQQRNTSGMHTMNNCLSCCQGLLCLNCCCKCMGGDLFHCC